MRDYQNTLWDWLRYRFYLLLNDSVSSMTKPLYWLHCNDMLPMWVVNIPFNMLPHSVRLKTVRANSLRWKQRRQMQKGGCHE